MKEVLKILPEDCFSILHNHATGRISALHRDSEVNIYDGFKRGLNVDTSTNPLRFRYRVGNWSVYRRDTTTTTQQQFLDWFARQSLCDADFAFSK